MFNIIAQIVGILAMTFAIISFQAKNNRTIVTFLYVASVFWTVHFIMLKVYAGAILNIVAVLRNVFYANKDKIKFVQSRYFVLLFSVIVVVVSVLTWKNAWDILAIAGSLITTFSLSLKNTTFLRYTSLCASPCWMVYDIVNKSIGGTLTELFSMISIIIALIRYRKKPAQDDSKTNVKPQ